MTRKSSGARYSICSTKDFNRLLVHPNAVKPFEIYTHHIFPNNIKSLSTIHLDVIKADKHLFFYSNFELLFANLVDTEIYTRKLDLSDKKITEASWRYIYDIFCMQSPINPAVYYAIKASIPRDIEKSVFGKLSIVQACIDSKIKRHQFDYYASKITHPSPLPHFDELIKEVINER